MNTRPIDIEFKRGGKILSSVIRVDANADLTTILTMARQLCKQTMSQAARVCVGDKWSNWVGWISKQSPKSEK